MATSQHDTSDEDALGSDTQFAEMESLREELRLCREELAMVREENERVVEDYARVTRGRRKAQSEATALAKALAEVLLRELRYHAGGRRRWVQRNSGQEISEEEWQQVVLLHQSPYFRPAWYLRRHLTVARRGIEPALHFLRHGALELRDPGPDFDIRDYLEQHPEVQASGENPVLHALSTQATGSIPAVRRTS